MGQDSKREFHEILTAALWARYPGIGEGVPRSAKPWRVHDLRGPASNERDQTDIVEAFCDCRRGVANTEFRQKQ